MMHRDHYSHWCIWLRKFLPSFTFPPLLVPGTVPFSLSKKNPFLQAQSHVQIFKMVWFDQHDKHVMTTSERENQEASQLQRFGSMNIATKVSSSACFIEANATGAKFAARVEITVRCYCCLPECFSLSSLPPTWKRDRSGCKEEHVR